MTKTLFDPVELGSLSLRNRVLRSATLEALCMDDGIPSGRLASVYEDLARGGVGTIITGMIGTDENARINDLMAKGYADEFVPAFRKVCSAARMYGSRVIAQISHCGAKASALETLDAPLAPSDFTFSPENVAREITPQEIASVVHGFSKTALNCKLAGADGVQLHGAHGYLLSQFLSPYFNHRTDSYGGCIENRSRIVFEVFDAVRSAVGDDFPILIKINAKDLVPETSSFREILWVLKELERCGLTAAEISGGLGLNRHTSSARSVANPTDDCFFASEAVLFADRLSLPIISVGGYRRLSSANRILNEGNVAAISFCRPLIREPDLISRWERGDFAPALCTSCNRCFFPKKCFGCQTLPSE